MNNPLFLAAAWVVFVVVFFVGAAVIVATVESIFGIGYTHFKAPELRDAWLKRGRLAAEELCERDDPNWPDTSAEGYLPNPRQSALIAKHMNAFFKTHRVWVSIRAIEVVYLYAGLNTTGPVQALFDNLQYGKRSPHRTRLGSVTILDDPAASNN